MKKDNLKTIKTYIIHMSETQLSDLYNIHSKLFPKSKKVKIPTSYLYKSYNEFIYYYIKHTTPKNQYINIINIIHLIISNYYNNDQIYTILHDLI